jgi:hypothetical protein
MIAVLGFEPPNHDVCAERQERLSQVRVSSSVLGLGAPTPVRVHVNFARD